MKSGCCSAMEAVILVAGFKSNSLSRRSYTSSGALSQPISCSSAMLLSEPELMCFLAGLPASCLTSAGLCEAWNSPGSEVSSHDRKPLRVSQRILRSSRGSSRLHTRDLPAFRNKIIFSQLKVRGIKWKSTYNRIHRHLSPYQTS